MQANYIKSVKSNLLNNIIGESFGSKFVFPKKLKNILKDHINEVRKVNIVSFDLNKYDAAKILQEPTEKDLEEFYNSNIELFTVPEKRSYQISKYLIKIY